MMTLSVLIPTLGRKQELIDTIESLLKQDPQPFEIIVVDQNIPEIPEVSRFLASQQIVKHVRHETKGVVINYNLCLKHARGDVVLFVDDDIIAHPGLIQAHLNNYKEDQKVGAVAGRILNQTGDLDPRHVRLTGQYFRVLGEVRAGFNALEKKEVEFGQGANMSFRREALVRAGGFDPIFDGNGYFFETDAGLRIRELGYKIIFDPAATVDHLMATSGGARVHDKALHTYHFAKNGMRLYRRHSPAAALPIYIARQIFYLSAKSIYNHQSRILTKGLKGLWDGLSVPMKKPSLE